jgi:DNA-binding MarR family transcriptional regulator
MPEHRQSRAVEAAEIISQIIVARRARIGFFRPELFSDPAWDLLLALFLAREREQTITVAELTEATATPISTAVRWIDVLERDGLVQRNPDPSCLDQDRVELSVRGTAAICQWLENCKRTSFFTLQNFAKAELGGGCVFRK